MEIYLIYLSIALFVTMFIATLLVIKNFNGFNPMGGIHKWLSIGTAVALLDCYSFFSSKYDPYGEWISVGVFVLITSYLMYRNIKNTNVLVGIVYTLIQVAGSMWLFLFYILKIGFSLIFAMSGDNSANTGSRKSVFDFNAYAANVKSQNISRQEESNIEADQAYASKQGFDSVGEAKDAGMMN